MYQKLGVISLNSCKCCISIFVSERDAFPRMAQPGTPEFEYAMRWKGLYENEKARKDELEAILADNRKQLEAEMEQFRHHEHANFLRIRKF